jgi:NADH:ubiquinone oxidoreductase subunit F (NADH-binding)
VAGNTAPTTPTAVVVNGAEGEPGSLKDRVIMRRNPFRLLEGALIAAFAVSATRVVIGVKGSFGPEVRRLRSAIEAVRAAGWSDGLDIELLLGPDAYLYGEETGLLEVASGRPPFPRVSPPFRRGVHDADPAGPSTAGTRSTPGTRSTANAAGTARAPGTSSTGSARPEDPARRGAPRAPWTIGPDADAPALVNNVETLSNVAGILAQGADWFRSLGTELSPGTVVCTVSGATARSAVGEVALGTPLREVIDLLGGGPRPDRRLRAVMSGVANPLLGDGELDVPVSYEGMDGVGAGLGAAGFIVFDDRTDLAGVAAGVARFLAVESCGQCEPCKRDGLALSDHLAALARSEADESDLRAVTDRLRTVADGARCYLASQQQRVIGSILERFGDDLRAHLSGRAGVEPMLISPLLEVSDGEAVVDGRHADKQPDWSHDEVDSGAFPAALGVAVTLEVGDGRRGHAADDPYGESAVPGAEQGSANPLGRRLRLSHVRLMDELVAAEDHAHVGGERSAPGADGAAKAPDAPNLVRDDVSSRRSATEDGAGRAADGDGVRVAETFEDAITMLEHDLRVHLDSVERVLYPMVRRVGGDEGETVAAHAEAQRARALEGLHAAHGGGSPDASAVRTLGQEVRTVLSVETAEMLPILQRNLDRQQLRDLANALSEAAASLPDATVDNDVV